MPEDIADLYERLKRDAAEGNSTRPLPAPKPLPTIHHTELKEDLSGGPLARPWNVYVREVGKLLAEGHGNKWVLIADEEVVGVFADRQDAMTLAYSTYRNHSPMVHQIREAEPVYRLSSRITSCRTSVARFTGRCGVPGARPRHECRV